jgi:hypothetical protein
MTEIIEFSCPYDYISRRRDSLKHVYEETQRNMRNLRRSWKDSEAKTFEWQQ